MTDLETGTRIISAVSPKIIRMFKILLPRMFPMVMPALSFNAAVMLTAASGALVPIATIVSPITSCGIPNLAAIPEAPSTNQSAPFTSIVNPAIIKSDCSNNCMMKKFLSAIKRDFYCNYKVYQ